jgi:nucleoside-diphosphate-sugar epimerase
MSRLLITGASGYIGRKLAEYYRNKEHELQLMVRDPEKIRPEVSENCQIVRGDIVQKETLKKAVEGIDCIIHCAGLLGHWGLSYRQLHDVNVKGTINLIKASFEAGIKRFIHLSAGGVTGPLENRSVDESYSPSPKTDYEKTKWEGEKRALEIALQEDLNLLVLRPTFTYGPGDPHKLNLFKAVQKGQFVFIGHGLSTVHPIYIDDLINGIDLALWSNIKAKTLIIGGSTPVTKRELIYCIADALEVKRPKLECPVWLANIVATSCELSAKLLKFNPPLTKSKILALSGNWGYSIQRAKEGLGYNPKIDLAEGIKRTVSWYREQRWL